MLGAAALGGGDQEDEVGRPVGGAAVDALAALRPKPSVGSATAHDRQCGMPMPPSMPVGICASRARTSARNCVEVGDPARRRSRSARERVASPPLGRREVEVDEVGGDQVRHERQLRSLRGRSGSIRSARVTAPWSRSSGVGMRLPGRLAAAAPQASASARALRAAAAAGQEAGQHGVAGADGAAGPLDGGRAEGGAGLVDQHRPVGPEAGQDGPDPPAAQLLGRRDHVAEGQRAGGRWPRPAPPGWA